MKKMLMLFALMAVVATGAMAQNDDGGNTLIGVFSHQENHTCDIDVSAGGNITLYFYALLDPEKLDKITAVEFVWDHPDHFAVVPDWETDLPIGNLQEGLALAFNPPIDGPRAYLGNVSFYSLPPGWIEGELEVRITAHIVGEVEILIVVDEDFTTFDVMGGRMTFNCVSACSCGSVAVSEANWGSIKALY